MSGTDFSTVPILDWSLLSSPTTRPSFLAQLQHALINVGFLYLLNPPIEPTLVNRLTAYAPRVFADLSQEEKDALGMVNSPHFLGYTALGKEQTKNAADMREQYDFASEYECRWREGEPEYLRLWGASQARA
jgi:isopenicillin N synthase-like dioxygenase